MAYKSRKQPRRCIGFRNRKCGVELGPRKKRCGRCQKMKDRWYNQRYFQENKTEIMEQRQRRKEIDEPAKRQAQRLKDAGVIVDGV